MGKLRMEDGEAEDGGRERGKSRMEEREDEDGKIERDIRGNMNRKDKQKIVVYIQYLDFFLFISLILIKYFSNNIAFSFLGIFP